MSDCLPTALSPATRWTPWTMPPTGDNQLVTQKVAHDVGLPTDCIVTGNQVDTMDDAAHRGQSVRDAEGSPRCRTAYRLHCHRQPGGHHGRCRPPGTIST